MGRWTLVLFFAGVGSLHFWRPQLFCDIVPPPLPARPAVYASGAAEIIGGIAALFPRLHRFARWWLTGVLLAVYPANIYQAIAGVPIRGRHAPRWLLWLRLPMQFLFIAWVWRVTRSDTGREEAG